MRLLSVGLVSVQRQVEWRQQPHFPTVRMGRTPTCGKYEAEIQ